MTYQIIEVCSSILNIREVVRESVFERDGVMLDPERNEREEEVVLQAEDFSEIFAKLKSHGRRGMIGRWTKLEEAKKGPSIGADGWEGKEGRASSKGR